MSTRTPKGIFTGSWGGFFVLLITLFYPGWSSPVLWFSTEQPSRIYFLILAIASIPLWYFAYIYVRDIHIDKRKWKLAFIISLLVLIYSAVLSIYLIYKYDVLLSGAPAFICIWLYILPDTIVFFRKACKDNENTEQRVNIAAE
jgi:hypothetical protein